MREPMKREVSKSSLGSLPNLKSGLLQKSVSREQLAKDAIHLYFDQPGDRAPYQQQPKLPIKKVK